MTKKILPPYVNDSKANRSLAYWRAEVLRLEHMKLHAKTCEEYTRIDHELARTRYNLQHLEMTLWDL